MQGGSLSSAKASIVVYAFVTDSSKTYGTVYYRIRISSALTILSALFAVWNVTNHSGAQQGIETAYSAFSTNNTIEFTALNGGSEYKFLFLAQTTAIVPP